MLAVTTAPPEAGTAGGHEITPATRTLRSCRAVAQVVEPPAQVLSVGAVQKPCSRKAFSVIVKVYSCVMLHCSIDDQEHA